MITKYNALIKHPKYLEYYNKILDLEKDRSFCHHDMTHFLDVARIAYILALEENLNISKEEIYLTALLHDIGRFEQYLYGTSHEIASARLCVSILEDMGIHDTVLKRIQTAIINHRNAHIADEKSLSGIIYRADKASRPCHSCTYESQCAWSLKKKNLFIKY